MRLNGVLFVASLLILGPAFGGLCKLEVLHDGPETTDSTYCVEEYDTSSYCQEFLETFNMSLLPPALREESVERPSNLMLTPQLNRVQKSGQWILAQGLNITWQSPASNSAKKLLKGFLMILSRDGNSVCYLFGLSSVTTAKMTFRYSFEKLRPRWLHTVKVYSLPPPPLDQATEPDTFRVATITTGSATAAEPGNYFVALSAVPEANGEIHVTINLSPENFNFTQYDVKLLKKSISDVNTFKDEVFHTQVATEDKKSAMFILKGLEVDDYKVAVRPKELFKDDPERCLCWSGMSSTGQTRFCTSCQQTDTDWFHLKFGAVTSEDDSDASTLPDNNVTSEKYPNGDSLDGDRSDGDSFGSRDLVIVVVVICVLIAGVIVGVSIICCRKCKENKKDLGDGEKMDTFETRFTPTWVHINRPLSPNAEKEEQGHLTTKNIYILNAQDHEPFEHLVNCLAKFLQVHCRCNVQYAAWSSECIHQEGTYKWLTTSMTKADLVLFVGSHAAQALAQAFMDKKTYRSYKTGPHGDLFTLGFQRIMNHGNISSMWDTVVPVTLDDEEWCRTFMSCTTTYHLPRDMPQLLQKIHGLSSEDTPKLDGILPLRVENLCSIQAGADLLQAVQVSKNYVQAHPQWMQEQLGQATRSNLPIRSISGDSDYGSLTTHRSLSVSNQDVSLSSPTSFTEAPVFTTHHYLGRQGSSKSLPSSSIYTKELPGDNCSVITLGTESQAASLFPSQGSRGTDHLPSQHVVVPPDSVSSVQCDDLSMAMDQFNQRSEKRASLQGARGHIHVVHIVPPDGLSDIQSESLSAGFNEINAASEQDC